MEQSAADKNNQWFHDILNNSLNTFAVYWGYEKAAERWKTEGRNNMSESAARDRVGGLQNALDWDKSGVTAFMMLRAYLHRLLHSTSFSAHDLMLNWESHKTTFDELNKMRLELEKPEALEIMNNYRNKVKEMGRHYNVVNEAAFDALADNPIDLGFLRYSAYLSVNKKLKSYQFLQGEGTTEKLKVHGKVYEFWNINSLIRAAANQLFDGVALCLIRDPKHFFASFFVYAVKAGENLTVLTDRYKGAHPRYNDMSRKPERELERRMNENWFPYHLLDIQIIETERGDIWKEKERTQLVPYNSELVPLADIGKLGMEETAWLGMVLELLAEKFGGVAPLRLPALSYTGEVVRNVNALVPAESSLILSGKYQTLDLPEIKPEEITAEQVAANFEKPSYGFNRHVFDRFVNQVPKEVYNLIGDNDVKQLRAAHVELSKEEKDTWGKLIGHKIELRSYSPLDFGTADELDKDRIWTARFNQISYINALAKKEFDAKRNEICAWYGEKVRANRDNLLDDVAAMECKMIRKIWRSGSGRGGFPFQDVQTKKLANILTFGKTKNKDGWGSRRQVYHHTDSTDERCSKKGHVFFGSYESYPFHYLCFSDNYTNASVFCWFEPENASELAYLAGVKVDELPEQIRYWTTEKPYVGNSILDRLDPEDWYLKDYFRDLEFHVTFTLSKTYLNRLRKEKGFERFDWDSL